MQMIENQYTRSDDIEAVRVQRWKAKCNMKDTPKWIAPDIPTAYHAHQLAREMCIEISSTDISVNMEGMIYAICYVLYRGEVFMGSAQHVEELCAKMFAYRNAVKDVLQAKKGEIAV